MTCKTEKRHSRSYTVSFKPNNVFLLGHPVRVRLFFMQLRFCADTLLCRHIFMQYDFVPFIRPHSYAAALFMQTCFYAVLDGNGSQGNGSEGGSWEPWGWPCPCAALWVSRPNRHDPPPAGRRRWNPGRIFHGWRPWCAPASPAFPAAGRPPVPPTDPAAGRSRRCR